MDYGNYKSKLKKESSGLFAMKNVEKSDYINNTFCTKDEE